MARLAILIGCSNYDDEQFRRLTKPTQDVNGLADVLESPSIGGFDSVVRMIDPAWHEVRPALTSFFRSSGPDDLLFIFFACHGIKDSRGELFFAFRNTQLDDLDGTAISDRFVARQMDRSRTEAQVLVLDCCFSGAFGRDTRATLGSSAGVLDAYADISNASVGVGRVVLTASDSIQYSWEGEEVKGDSSNSIFTRSLIFGLKSGEADRDRDGIIAIDELYEYLLISVASTNRSQVPQLLARPGPRHGAICIARNLSANLSFVDLPNSLSKRLVSKEHLVRFTALADAAKLAKKSGYYEPALRRRFADIALKDPDKEIRYYAWQLLRSEDAKLGPMLVRSRRATEVKDVMPAPFEWCSIPPGYVTLEGVRGIFPVSRFQISKYPITDAQFDVFASTEDGYAEDEWWLGLAVRHHTPVKQPLTASRLPRVRVSWYETVAFCRWLTAMTGF